MNHEQIAQAACDRALAALNIKNLRFRPMKRKNNRVNTRRGYVIGRTNLKTGLITIDIFTPKFRKPKKISSILRTLAHEAAHHQKPPYRQRHRGRIIARQHYPIFYRQVNRNILKLKKDKILSEYFNF
ncbi:hypothetical protein KJ586_00945 [Patescibacteria group bacterium]|nr:hypothetical protein [Patescibacteria group bacterium]MBU4346953.1 hypothetical protein [Patescibacteria group bacterium]MBU4455061.1 hypothetical protein [Patescibacteria group bacterium]